jgi:glycosyltransferase involved in cell wall biosynthesis
MIDIANTFFDSGYKVSLVTGRLVQRNTPLEESVKLDRIIRYRRNTILGRLITWLVAFIQILFKIWFKYRKHYLFIVSNPPMAPLIPIFCSNSYSLLIYDVYIEKLEEFKLLNSKSLPVRLWKGVHSKVLANADKIFTLTKGMSAKIEKYSSTKKCEIVPVWTDNDFLKPVKHELNPFIINNNLKGKFIILYSGSIGASSGLDYLLDVASIINSDDIIFLIIGDGFGKNALMKKNLELDLKNTVFLPWQDVNIFAYSLAAADLAVVTLGNKSSNNAIPSKLFNYMSVGVPVLCLADKESDLGKLVIREKIGNCFFPTMKHEIAEYILQLYQQPIEVERLGNNSLSCSMKYTKENTKKFLIVSA